jgi:hypothetical protein
MIVLAEIVTMADVLKIVFIIGGFFIAFVGYWLLGAGLLPAVTERCAEQYLQRPVRITLLGLVTFGPLIALGSAIASAPNPVLKIVGVALLLGLLLIALFGSAGLALRIGIGLRSANDEREPWRRVWRGGLVLSLSFILPLIGTFLLMPWAFVSGFGAFILSMRTPRSAAAILPGSNTVGVAAPPPPIPASVL